MTGGDRRDTLGIAEEAASWLMALKERGVSNRAAFVKWLRGSPRHVEEFLLMTASDQAMRNLDRHRSMDVDRMIAQLSDNVVELEKNEVRSTPVSRPKRVARLAAVAAGIALISGWALIYFDRWETYATTIGEQRAVQLADGSLIHLNARSKLTVRLSDDRRDVRLLEGEALFKVARDISRPFRVETDRVVVRALGTAFNVDRRAHDTLVAVLEGAVEVTPARVGAISKAPATSVSVAQESASPAKLSAGEEIRVASSGTMAHSKGNTADAVAWRQRLLVFSDSSLEEIATEFNRYNRKQQLVIDDDRLRDERFGGTFDADEPLALIEFLRRTPGLMVVDEGDRLVIRRR